MTTEEIKDLAYIAGDEQFGSTPCAEKVHFRVGFQVGYEKALQDQWIDIYDHSPESNLEVLGFDGRLIYIIIFNDEKYHDLNGVELDEIQYWMYMPEKPKS